MNEYQRRAAVIRRLKPNNRVDAFCGLMVSAIDDFPAAGDDAALRDLACAAGSILCAALNGMSQVTRRDEVSANLVTVLNPSRLLLGGGVLTGSPRMMKAAVAGIDAHASKPSRAALKIGAPELGDQAGVVGAALLARSSLAQAA